MNLKELNKKLLKRPAVRKAMEENRLAYEIAEAVMDARIKKGMTQAELAKKVGTKQPSIARVERGETSANNSFLERIAKALGMRLIAPKFEELEVEFIRESNPITQINYIFPKDTRVDYSFFNDYDNESENQPSSSKKIITY